MNSLPARSSRLRPRRLALFPCLALVLAALDLRADSLAQFHLPLGEIVVVLYDQDKPVTVTNFRQCVQDGRFNDSFVQRWEPGFVIQGGGWFVTNRLTAAPGLTPIRASAPIVNEFAVGRRFSNAYATIAMARAAGQTNSATSQWFFNLADNTGLDAVDGGFTVFGRVAAGTNVLNRFNSVALTNGIYMLNLGGSLATLPVLSPNPTYSDLVYTDITLPEWPRAQVTLENDGSRRIRWNSLARLTNHIEFSRSCPPIWQTLASPVGTGGTLEFRDTRAPTPAGFYRIRVE
jgi:cyclophilin family peptidyl-prolyl cis-trans isomerase